MTSKVMNRRILGEICEGFAEEICKMGGGARISHEIMKERLQSFGSKTVYYERVEHLRKVLISEHGVFLKTLSGYGYEVLPPGRSWEVPKLRLDRSDKERNRAIAELCHIDLDKIPDESDRFDTMRLAQSVLQMKSADQASIKLLERMGGGIRVLSSA